MDRKISAIAALAVITTKVGIPFGAYAQEAFELEERCQIYEEIEDPSILQAELELLLDLRPDDPCISFLVERLGGGPLAEIPPEQYD